MTSADVAKVAVRAAHADGIKKGVSKVTGFSVFGVALVVVGAVGVIALLNQKANSDKKDAIYQAENRSFSSGVDIGKKEAFDAQRQVSRVVSV